MRTYFIVRKGSNAANQSMQEISILGITNGINNAHKICGTISRLETDITVYNNQYIEYWTHKEIKKYYGVKDAYKELIGDTFTSSEFNESFLVAVE